MDTPKKHQPRDRSEASLFPPTQWTVLLKPLHDREPGEREALERLFEIYRRPILRYIQAYENDPNNAEDMAHDFILKLLCQDDIARLDRSKGSFRSFLLTAIKNFLVTAHRSNRALKRGGRWVHVPIEEMQDKLAWSEQAEGAFSRDWVESIDQEAVRRLALEWAEVGKATEFTEYEPFIREKKAGASRAEIAAKHGVSVSAVNVRILRLRERYRTMLREIVAETSGGVLAAEEEIRLVLRELS